MRPAQYFSVCSLSFGIISLALVVIVGPAWAAKLLGFDPNLSGLEAGILLFGLPIIAIAVGAFVGFVDIVASILDKQ